MFFFRVSTLSCCNISMQCTAVSAVYRNEDVSWCVVSCPDWRYTCPLLCSTAVTGLCIIQKVYSLFCCCGGWRPGGACILLHVGGQVCASSGGWVRPAVLSAPEYSMVSRTSSSTLFLSIWTSLGPFIISGCPLGLTYPKRISHPCLTLTLDFSNCQKLYRY